MQNAAARKLARDLAKAAKAAASAAAATETDATDAPAPDATDAPAPAPMQADAPAPDAPAPETVTLSARAARIARAEAHIAAGADKRNVRFTTDIAVPVGIAKYDFSHVAKLAFAKRISALPAGTQAFYHANARAYPAGCDAAQLDNAKLARLITAGLASVTGLSKPDSAGRAHRVNGGAVLVTFRTAAQCDAEAKPAKP